MGNVSETEAEVPVTQIGYMPTLAAEVAGNADKATGALAEGDLDRVVAAYRELPDTKVRNRAKKHLQEQVADEIGGDVVRADQTG